MKRAACLSVACLMAALASAASAGTFRVFEVTYDTQDWGYGYSYKVTTDAKARYIGAADRNDHNGLLQTTVKSNKDAGAANSLGLNLTGPFREDQVVSCEGSCGAWKVFRKLDCPINKAMDSFDAVKLFYGGAGKVAIYHRRPEIHILDDPASHQVPCNPRLIKKYGVWEDGQFPVPGPYRHSHFDLDLCYYKRTITEVRVTDPTGTTTTTSEFWDFYCL